MGWDGDGAGGRDAAAAGLTVDGKRGRTSGAGGTAEVEGDAMGAAIRRGR